MTRIVTRRTFLRTGTVAAAAAAFHPAPFAAPRAAPLAPLPLKFAVKFGMVGIDGSVLDKFELLRELGFDGVELDSPSQLHRDEVLRARDKSGLPIHGVVDSIHWNVRLSSPDAAVRERGRAGLETAIRDAKAYGGSSVLLVPGRVGQDESHEQVWERSIAEIRNVLPLAAELGIRILIENVWNGFCYQHDGPGKQSPDQLVAYLDEIASPWVGSYFDIGNHRKYADVAAWIRALAHRIVKLDVKDWGEKGGFGPIGEGDVPWPEVRAALAEIGFTGWATAEVTGGGREQLAAIRQQMDRVLRA
jgi:hexulose-6-phosphate isomerase